MKTQKYNKSEIMKKAHKMYKAFAGSKVEKSFSQCLKFQWDEAKWKALTDEEKKEIYKKNSVDFKRKQDERLSENSKLPYIKTTIIQNGGNVYGRGRGYYCGD